VFGTIALLAIPMVLVGAWGSRPPRRTEYVLSDAAGAQIAVVRPRPRQWVDEPAWSTKQHCRVGIGKPGDTPALLLVRDKSSTQVWVAPGRLLGIVKYGVPRRLSRRLRFSNYPGDHQAGSPVPVMTGSQEGRVRPISGPNVTWSIDDVSGLQVACITSRSFVSSAVTKTSQDGVRTLRRRVKEAIPAANPWVMACEVTESRPQLDWNQHGLLVALAALCDARVRTKAFPPTGGAL
jgi:hypothetical protein